MTNDKMQIVVNFKREVTLDAMMLYARYSLDALQVKYRTTKQSCGFSIGKSLIYLLDPAINNEFRGNRKHTKTV